MSEDKSLALSSHLTESCVKIGLEVSGAEEILETLAREAEHSGLVSDHRLFFEQLKLREAEMSTGVGLGLAVPHAEVAGAKHTFVIGTTLSRPVEYKSIDNEPVDVVFLIGGKPGEVGLHLQLVARIARLARQPRFMALLRSQETAEGFISVVKEAEDSLYSA